MSSRLCAEAEDYAERYAVVVRRIARCEYRQVIDLEEADGDLFACVDVEAAAYGHSEVSLRAAAVDARPRRAYQHVAEEILARAPRGQSRAEKESVSVCRELPGRETHAGRREIGYIAVIAVDFYDHAEILCHVACGAHYKGGDV